jgi:hypothetical protein
LLAEFCDGQAGNLVVNGAQSSPVPGNIKRLVHLVKHIPRRLVDAEQQQCAKKSATAGTSLCRPDEFALPPSVDGMRTWAEFTWNFADAGADPDSSQDVPHEAAAYLEDGAGAWIVRSRGNEDLEYEAVVAHHGSPASGRTDSDRETIPCRDLHCPVETGEMTLSPREGNAPGGRVRGQDRRPCVK